MGGGGDRRILTLILVQPDPDAPLPFSIPKRLQSEPRYPVSGSLAAIAIGAAADQVRPVSLAAFGSWSDVIECRG